MFPQTSRVHNARVQSGSDTVQQKRNATKVVRVTPEVVISSLLVLLNNFRDTPSFYVCGVAFKSPLHGALIAFPGCGMHAATGLRRSASASATAGLIVFRMNANGAFHAFCVLSANAQSSAPYTLMVTKQTRTIDTPAKVFPTYCDVNAWAFGFL